MIAALTLVACCSLATGAVHPQHVTLAEAEWNPESRSLEIALRITPVQLEEAVERHAGRPVDLDAGASDAAVAAWLAAAFVVAPPDPDPADDEAPDPVALKYVGKEVGVSRAWLYFEAPLPGGWEGATIANRVRLATEPEQHNTLILTVARVPAALVPADEAGPGGKPRKERATYTFDRRTPQRALKADDLKPLKRSP